MTGYSEVCPNRAPRATNLQAADDPRLTLVLYRKRIGEGTYVNTVLWRALSIKPFEGTRWFGRAIAHWVLNRSRVSCGSDLAIEQLILDMAVALPNIAREASPALAGSFKR